ncbi:pumilio homolog 12-like [Silene latifolia]|uniref:pumilio homolog 12-like n=1 Tax=Silene latifolia TaxID=37657 RepID=UPI003D778DDC
MNPNPNPNPNQFQWRSFPSSSSLNYQQQQQTLEQQFNNLNLNLISESPINVQNSELFRRPNYYNNHDNILANHILSNNNYSYQNPRIIPNSSATAAMNRRRAINSRIEDEYLAMLWYLEITGNNQFSGSRNRVRNNNYNYNYNSSRGNYNYNYNPNRVRNENYGINLGISWEELRGNVGNYVKDHQKCKLVHQMLEKANKEEIKMIISEIKDELREIIVTHNGGQFFQNLLDYCDDQDVTLILKAAMVNQRYFVDICLDNHGSRAMQKLIKKIDGKNAEQKSIILSMMKEVMLTLITNMNSYYFVTELFSSLKGPAAYDLIMPLFDDIAEHFMEIAVDKFGCCALHICLEHGHRGPHRDRILNKIVSHAVELSQNDYGNYVVQYVISKPQERFSNEIIRSLYGKFAYFCMNKYACHVVEKCILFGTNEHLESIIKEIMEDQNFLKILLDQTGNYVVQTAITRCNEVAGHSERLASLFNSLTEGVIAKYPFLHYDRLGKHVLLCARTEKEKHRRRLSR